MTAPDTPAASALDGIRDRAGIVAKLGPPRPGGDLINAAHRSAADVPRLLAAVEAALKLADEAELVERDYGGEPMWWSLSPAELRAAITAALTENDSAPAGAVKEDGGP